MITVNKSSIIAGSDKTSKISYEYKGLSTDMKPTNCGVNSLFWELDTNDFYYYDGTEWKKVGA